MTTSLLPQDALRELEAAMADGARNHEPSDSWERQSVRDHLEHLALHLVSFAFGDTSEPHLRNAACRGVLALAVHLRSGRATVPPAGTLPAS